MAGKKTQSGHIRIGTSGYVYDHWNGLFYPSKIPKKHWFEYYAGQFDTVELNATFYRLFPEKTFEKWHTQASADFIYAVKLWRWTTHRKRLNDISGDLKTFLSRAALLKEHLGPILVQLPPGLHRNDERLEEFLEVSLEIQMELRQRFRFAVEFRHESWFQQGVYEMLRRRNVALVLPDMPKLKGIREVTADLIYVRFHGHTSLYGSLYSPQMLSSWAQWLRGYLDNGVDVYAYFNNDDHAYAIQNARMLRRYLAGD